MARSATLLTSDPNSMYHLDCDQDTEQFGYDLRLHLMSRLLQATNFDRIMYMHYKASSPNINDLLASLGDRSARGEKEFRRLSWIGRNGSFHRVVTSKGCLPHGTFLNFVTDHF